MEGGVVATILVAVVLVAAIAGAIRIVPPAHAGVVERLGRYTRTLQPGVNFIVPLIDRLRTVVDRREQILTPPPITCITEDNAALAVEVVLYYQIEDPVRAVYQIADLPAALEQLTVTTLRNATGTMGFDRARASHLELSQLLQERFPEHTGEWGAVVALAEIKSIRPTDPAYPA